MILPMDSGFFFLSFMFMAEPSTMRSVFEGYARETPLRGLGGSGGSPP